MKILFVLLFLVSCNEREKAEPVVQSSSSLYKYRDEENNVTCYRASGYEGLSCVRDNQ